MPALRAAKPCPKGTPLLCGLLARRCLRPSMPANYRTALFVLPMFQGPLIDWDIILVMEPSTILGALLGGYLNKVRGLS